MNRGRTVLSWALGGVMLGAVATAQSQPSAARGRPVQFSDPKRDEATTNLNQMVARKVALQSVEDGLKQMNILDLADPTRKEATITAPHIPPPNFNSKQFKVDKSKDWVFKTQEDYEAQYGLTAEEIFKVPKYGPDGKPKKEQSQLDKYYDRIDASRNSPTNGVTKDDSLFGDKKDTNEDRFNKTKSDKKTEKVSDFSTVGEQALKRLSGDSIREAMAPDTGKPRTIADVFGINEANSPAALREQRQQELQLEKFRKLLDPNFVPATPIAATAPAAPAGFVPPKPLGNLPAAATGFGSLPSISGASLQPQGLPEMPRLPDFNTPLPKPETPAPAAPPPSGFALPKRKF